LSICWLTVDDDVTGWLTNPGCFLWLKEATATSLGQPLEARVSDVQRVLLATFSNTLTRPLGSLARRFLTSTHLAPSFVSRGGTAIQLLLIADFRLKIEKLFTSSNLQSELTKILPAFAGVPDARAPVVI